MHYIAEDTLRFSSQNAMMLEFKDVIDRSWKNVAPAWPLENMVAVNPLMGFVEFPFSDAVSRAASLYQRKRWPEQMGEINRISIKWLQVLLDEGQAAIEAPGKERGLFSAFRRLACWDDVLGNVAHGAPTLKELPDSAQDCIEELLRRLEIPIDQAERFLTLILTTLFGWSANICFRADWMAAEGGSECKLDDLKCQYLAMRLIIAYLVWPTAKDLLDWDVQQGQTETGASEGALRVMREREAGFRMSLLRELKQSSAKECGAHHPADAQLVFCIDVRSEPLRHAIEQCGSYQTFGFAGFFGVPLKVASCHKHDEYSSCPVLLKPQHEARLQQSPNNNLSVMGAWGALARTARSVYQSLKYAFSTPFPLAEMLGVPALVSMVGRVVAPSLCPEMLERVALSSGADFPEICTEAISLDDRVSLAESALRLMGLVDNFADVVVLCGHASRTTNNPFASSLDCGACGGRPGGPNASVLAGFLNQSEVRDALAERGVVIPSTCIFLSALHNTTTDSVNIHRPQGLLPRQHQIVQELGHALDKVGNKLRHGKGLQRVVGKRSKPSALQACGSMDWSEVRPEWGLARNAGFIVGPRSLTKNIDLGGRCFLHSYEWSSDPESQHLRTIMTAPMIVAHWINMQYLFSTMDNVAYGAGSKITLNVTGKFGVMQGNGSDLMTGLPLQSVFVSDQDAYHEPLRLLVVIHAPRDRVATIIQEEDLVRNLVKNQWIHLVVIDPHEESHYSCDGDLNWVEC